MNEEAKRKILQRIPYGLYVIGVTANDIPHAFTGSWLSQCSMKPPLVMLGVRASSQSFEMIKAGGVFSVNFVAKSDKKIVEQFFKPTPAHGNRFGDLTFTAATSGAPVLEAAIAYLECRVREAVPAGDHAVVIGEVIEAEIRRDEAPLVMSDTPWHYGG